MRLIFFFPPIIYNFTIPIDLGTKKKEIKRNEKKIVMSSSFHTHICCNDL